MSSNPISNNDAPVEVGALLPKRGGDDRRATGGRLNAHARRLAERYVPLARKLAWRATRAQGAQFDDVYSDALWGLTKAARNHTPDRPFAPYAIRCIEGAILHGRRDRFGWRSGRKYQRPMFVPLDTAAPSLCGKPLVETLVDEQTPTPEEGAERSEVWQAVATLPAPLRTTVALYYRWDVTQAQIAAALGISQMQVSRRLSRARELLSESLGSAA